MPGNSAHVLIKIHLNTHVITPHVPPRDLASKYFWIIHWIPCSINMYVILAHIVQGVTDTIGFCRQMQNLPIKQTKLMKSNRKGKIICLKFHLWFWNVIFCVYIILVTYCRTCHTRLSKCHPPRCYLVTTWNSSITPRETTVINIGVTGLLAWERCGKEQWPALCQQFLVSSQLWIDARRDNISWLK